MSVLDLFGKKGNVFIKEISLEELSKEPLPNSTLHYVNVPDFEYVLIHWGNTDDDTDGCLIIGRKHGMIETQMAVLDSRSCYEKWYPVMAKAISTEPSTIQYIRK